MRRLGTFLLVIIFVVHAGVGMPQVVQDALELADTLDGRFYGNLLLDFGVLVGIGALSSHKLSVVLAGTASAGFWGMTYTMTDAATSHLRPGTFYAARAAIRVSDALERLYPYYLILTVLMALLWFRQRNREIRASNPAAPSQDD